MTLMRAASIVVALVVTACGLGSDAPEGASELTVIENPADAPTWAVPYGHEPWLNESGVNVSRVIERVHHAIRVDPATGLPRVKAFGYEATFDGEGMRFAVGDAEARLQTTRIAFGDDAAYTKHGVPWSMLGNTAQTRLTPSIVEHYEARGDGVEVTWLVRERAPGDLTIEVESEGLLAVAQSDGTVQLVDGAAHARGHIGAAELVDVTGQRFAVETRVVAGGVRWRASAEVLAQAQFPVAIDPLISPEILVADPVLGTSLEEQYSPHVAASSTGYLVEWIDRRNGTVDIYAARVSPLGALLDPAGIRIAANAGYAEVQVGSNGTDYLVGWSSAPLKAVRVSNTGLVLDTTPLAIAPRGNFPNITSNGSDYLVTWAVYRNDSSALWDAYAARMTAAGGVLDPNPIPIATRTGPFSSAASNGSNYLVTFQLYDPTYAHVFARRLGFDGVWLDSGGVQVGTGGGGEWAAAAASDGTDYFVVWNDNRNSNETDIYGAKVAGSGVPAGEIAVTTAPREQKTASIAWNGAAYLAVWEDDRLSEYRYGYDIFGARIDPTGTVLDPNGISITSAGMQFSPSVAARGGGDFLVSWQEIDDNVSSDIYAQRITSAGVPAAPKVAIALTPNMYEPAMASNGTSFLVAWKDARTFESTGLDILGARLSSTGEVLDPAGIVLSNAPSHQFQPAVASNGTDYLVAWTDIRNGSAFDVYGTRVAASGAVLDQAGLPLSTAPSNQDQVTIASAATEYLVAWRDNRNVGTYSGDLYGTHVSSTGTIVDPNGLLLETVPYSNEALPSLASNGSSYLLAWVGHARRLTLSGVADTPQIAAGGRAASNGTDYLLVSGLSNGVRASRVSAAGTLMDSSPILVSSAPVYGCVTTAASDGNDYLIAWGQDCSSMAVSSDIYAARISAAGVVSDSPPLVISAAPARETNPVIAYNAASHGYGIAYEARQQTYFRLVRFCGDSTVDGTETCDDGAYINGDGCNASCRVEPGYACTGSPSTCTDIDECATNNGGCSPNAICTNATPGFSCACASGYTGDGFTCTDIDECATNNGGCSALATCTNTPGSFTCACNAGYAGNGVTCTDIDECATNSGGCAGACANSTGSYACSCPTGFVLASDGHACDDIDECATNNGGCAAFCMNSAGSYACSCPAGFALDGDGHACVDVDECATNNGGCAQICSNTAGGFTCECGPGYTLGSDHASCTATDACVDCTDEDTGCGCRTNDPSQSALWLLVLGVLVRRRRREYA